MRLREPDWENINCSSGGLNSNEDTDILDKSKDEMVQIYTEIVPSKIFKRKFSTNIILVELVSVQNTFIKYNKFQSY